MSECLEEIKEDEAIGFQLNGQESGSPLEQSTKERTVETFKRTDQEMTI